MARHRSPFSVGQRKTVFISSNDPRSPGLENFRSKLGSDVKVKNLGTPLKFSKAYWMESYNSNTTGQGTNVTIGDATAGAIDSSDNFIVGGYTKNGSTDNNGTLLSISPSKIINWQRLFIGFNSILDVDVDSSGNIYALLTKISSNNPYLIKYSPSGTLLWQSAIAVSAQNSQAVSSISVDINDDPIFSFRVNVTSTTGYEAIIKLNKTTGAIVWQQKFTRGSNSLYNYFRITSDISGDVYFVATDSTGFSHYVGKLNGSNGTYNTGFKTTGLASFTANVGGMTGITIDKKDVNKNIYVVWSGLTSIFDATTAKDIITNYDSSGNLNWSKGIQISGSSTYSYRGFSPMGKLHILNQKYFYETSVLGNWHYIINGNISDGTVNGYINIGNANSGSTGLAINLSIPTTSGDIYGAGRYQGIETNSSGSTISTRTRLMAFRLPNSSLYNKTVLSTAKNPAIKVNFSYSYNAISSVGNYAPAITSNSGLAIANPAYTIYTGAPLTETKLTNQISFTQFTIAT